MEGDASSSSVCVGPVGAEESSGAEIGTFLTSLRVGDEKGDKSEKPRLAATYGVVGLGRVEELHGQLSGVVGSLSSKIGDLLKKQENEFLSAYRAHVYNVQKELHELRSKVKNAELELQRDDTIRQLTNERDWFRKEALRLDTYSTAMKKEIKFMEEKMEAIEEDRRWLEKQLKNSKKQSKLLRTELELELEQRQIAGAGEREGTLPPAVKALKNCHSASSLFDTKNSARHTKDDTHSLRSKSTAGHYTSSRMDMMSTEMELGTLATGAGGAGAMSPASSNHAIKTLRDRLTREKDSVKELRAILVQDQTERAELEEFFLKCVDDVKKDVARRKNRAKLEADKKNTKGMSIEPSERDLRNISRRDMSAQDRRRIIEKMLENEDIFDILYSNLFPATRGGDEPRSPGSGIRSIEDAHHVAEMDLPQLLRAIP